VDYYSYVSFVIRDKDMNNHSVNSTVSKMSNKPILSELSKTRALNKAKKTGRIVIVCKYGAMYVFKPNGSIQIEIV
jgi:hypothetical protein